MKVQLTVVQGKPEGKVIPLALPNFKIGRGETCHLRPNSEQVSREHAEISISDGQVSVCDLNSRNGTFVNGKRVTQSTILKDSDLVQIGPLTFSVSIQGAPVRAASAQPAPTKTSDIDKVPDEDIESWLIADSAHSTPSTKSGVYDGATGSFETVKGLAELKVKTSENAKPEAAAPTPPPAEEEAVESEDNDAESESNESEEWVDENNPFHQKKKPQAETASATSSKASFKDSADAAGDILKRMMERRRAKS